MKWVVNRAGIKPELVEEVVMGNVIHAAQGQNVARQAAVKAGLPVEVPAMTINKGCGSGLRCVAVVFDKTISLLFFVSRPISKFLLFIGLVISLI